MYSFPNPQKYPTKLYKGPDYVVNTAARRALVHAVKNLKSSITGRFVYVIPIYKKLNALKEPGRIKKYGGLGLRMETVCKSSLQAPRV